MKDPEQVDAVEMVRAIRDRQYEVLKDESPEERRQFYAEQARRLHKRLQGTFPGGGATAAEGNE
jgi:hypothetical protein